MFAAAPLITFEQVIPFALFGMVAAAAWWILESMAAGKPRAVERLAELKNPRARRNATSDALVKKPDTVSRILEKTSALGRPLQSKNEAEVGKLKTKLANGGFRSENASAVFLTIKFTALLIGFFFGGGSVLTLRGMNQNSFIWAAAVTGLFFWLPDMVVGFIVKSRQQAIFLALPDALDMMVVCVEAGLGLDQAMRRVSEEMKASYPIMSAEFTLTNFQLQMGRTRADALHDLGTRTGVSDLRSLAGVLIQADKYGSSIALALRVQSEAMRTRRRQIAEEKAAKTAVKLLFPLILFIFPGIFVILVGPAAIVMIREMFPKMAGN